MTNRLQSSQSEPNPNLAGFLLVAAPNQNGNQLAHTVCLIAHHSSKGAAGVVLNRGFRQDARDLWEEIAGMEKEYQQDLLHVGGPDSGPVVALHNSPKYAECETGDGVFLAAQVQNLQALVQGQSRNSAIKIMVGQVVWQPGQLEEQFRAGQWAVLPITSKVVFADEATMWKTALRQVGNRFVEYALGRSAPEDILCN